MAVLFVFSLIASFIPIRLTNIPVLGSLINLAIGAAESFFLTPLLTAVHRFILIDEVTRGYAKQHQFHRGCDLLAISGLRLESVF